MEEPERPSPEQMLARAAAEEKSAKRGRLKVFFGASPGVGKTYAMLEEAQAARRKGVDVAIGWVETHGRVETERLAARLERLPPRVLDYRGIGLREFDLDAALARRPGLLLVDELAHTNAEGSRHARRWQDVEELLDAGLDVATTLNVQHVESLNDVIAQITGIVVRETVPDSVIDRADEIEFVDCGPDELLKRLEEGKVYVPEQAARAIQSFFRKGNLIALRELALRRTAERVDDQATEWKREQGIRQPWLMRERILVAVGPAPSAANVVRAGARMAKRLRAPWLVLSVETPAAARLPASARDQVSAHLQLGERLGAETLVVRGERVADEILSVARERSVTRIVVGKPTHSRWREGFGGSLVDRLVRGSGSIDVLMTAGEKGQDETRVAVRPRLRAPFRHYALAVAAVAMVTGAGKAASPWIALADQAMLYLLGIVAVAARCSLGPSLAAAVLSVASLNFFFVEPFYTFAVADLRHLLTFVILLAAGIFVSGLTLRIRELADAARERERRTAALFTMSRAFMDASDPREIAEAAMRQIGELLGAETVVLLANEQGLAPAAGGVPEDARELPVARWVHEHGRPAGRTTDTIPGADHLFLPISGTKGPLGVFGVSLGRRAEPLAPSQRQLLETMVAQAALAIERATLGEEAARAAISAETERTRSTLLSAVSHDLRSPLVALRGAAEVLDGGTPLDPATRHELLGAIRTESDRLHRLIEDLLDLTRIEAGSLEVRKEWLPVEESVVAALDRVRARLGGRPVAIDLGEDLLMVPADATLLEQIFVNLLENAAKYSPPGTAIAIQGRRTDDHVEVDVSDSGPGLPPGSEEKVFERFYRAPDRHRAEGTGLGLAICRAIAKVHGGTISAANRPGGGARFRLSLPSGGAPPELPEEEDGAP